MLFVTNLEMINLVKLSFLRHPVQSYDSLPTNLKQVSVLVALDLLLSYSNLKRIDRNVNETYYLPDMWQTIWVRGCS